MLPSERIKSKRRQLYIHVMDVPLMSIQRGEERNRELESAPDCKEGTSPALVSKRNVSNWTNIRAPKGSYINVTCAD